MRHGLMICSLLLLTLCATACEEELPSAAMPDWDTVACFGITPPDGAWSTPAGPLQASDDAGATDVMAGDVETSDALEAGPTEDAQDTTDTLEDAVTDAVTDDITDAVELSDARANDTGPADAGPTDDSESTGKADDPDGRDGSAAEPTASDVDPCETAPGQCVGLPPAEFDLHDFQPQSCGYDAVYGLDLYKGRITVVGLMAAWCGFCQSQVQYMEQMRYELQTAGYDVEFLAINAWNALAQQEKLLNRCAFPLLQDQENIDVWTMMDGGKDDFYIYDREGNLAVYLGRTSEAWPGALALPEGYEKLRSAILSVE
jgi:thiol-disulfide isomerase/thioredoxin